MYTQFLYSEVKIKVSEGDLSKKSGHGLEQNTYVCVKYYTTSEKQNLFLYKIMKYDSLCNQLHKFQFFSEKQKLSKSLANCTLLFSDVSSRPS
uniref:Uncharacterized protein n=1 Tax=Anguilla anguilla TaxID=7936 RepID=A0A0E9XA21_ANGAN